MKPNTWMVRALWSTVAFLVVIGVGVAVRRGLQLTLSDQPAGRPSALNLDAGFIQHRVLTLVHIAPGLLFMLLGPLQFMPKLRARRPRFHRWCGRIFVAAGTVIG